MERGALVCVGVYGVVWVGGGGVCVCVWVGHTMLAKWLSKRKPHCRRNTAAFVLCRSVRSGVCLPACLCLQSVQPQQSNMRHRPTRDSRYAANTSVQGVVPWLS